MAGQKESPRQKMIGMMYLVLTALLALNVSKEILQAFVVVNEGLRSTHANMAENTNSLYADFQYAYDNDPAKVGENWNKALLIRAAADSLFDHITEMKAQLIAETEGLPLADVLYDSTCVDANGKECTIKVLMPLSKVLGMDNYDVTTNILVGSDPDNPRDGSGSATELKQFIHNYRDLLMSYVKLDDSLLNASPVYRLLTMPEVVKNYEEEMNWEAGTFYHSPLAAVVTILSKLQADIRSTEADIVQYLYNEFDTHIIKVNHMEAAIIPYSSYLLQGDTFRARVFIAASDTNKQPEMFFGQGLDPTTYTFGNGSSQLDVNGGMGYINIPASEIGEHTWDGYINYKTDDGRVLTYPYTTTYKVAAPSAAISPTKMNVLYKGVDNPIAISAGGVDQDKLHVSINNGTISKVGGEYVAEVMRGTTATITVTAETPDGGTQSMGSMEFRVMDLPPPTFYFAGLTYEDTRISQQDARAAGSVGVKLQNSVFKATFTVVSYDVWVAGQKIPGQGASLSSSIQDALARVRPGERIEFENVRVKYPDNVTRPIGGLSLTVY